MGCADRAQFVKDLAVSVGFDRCRIARAGPIGRGAYLRTWLENGRAGSMAYLGRHLECRLAPAGLLDGAKSVIMVALLYRQEPPPRICSTADSHGKVAMYAWGDDYHGIVTAKLSAMVDRMRAELAEPFEARACVDTAPLVEREWAAAAGIGWIGKNTMVLDHKLGSYFFLGGLVTTLQIPGWYANLAKPTWTPPDWVFGPAWSLLYLMMAVAAWSRRSNCLRTTRYRTVAARARPVSMPVRPTPSPHPTRWTLPAASAI